MTTPLRRDSRCPAPLGTVLFWLLISTLLLGCQASIKSDLSLDADGRVGGILSGHDLWMELAFTDASRQRGLMFRQQLDDAHGMLFVFERAERLSFWMRNTYIPLDIGYFDREGVLREIHPLYPLDETPVLARSNQLQFALEVNRGWFAARGVQPGARLDLEVLADAIRTKNGNPAQFGLE